MRKKAQERKRAMSPPSNSSSSVSNNPPMDSMPFMETKERSFYDAGGDHDQMSTPKGFEEGESTETGYSMDDIWKDIALSESETMETVCETIMASPIWN
ncbi:myb-related protein MYBAS1-like [Camellia sinensis]|uniref:myb-related protein MYBAS1-like n=1 Tax=Camellia sinensis TaxID=4442 RepID=UPI0010369C7B|nr:myb-related protein MYBAS1-like [Camellia sinensis]